ncbi:MAG: hypothetical protein ACR2NN_14215 [Bryobacteraceae bacterium]
MARTALVVVYGLLSAWAYSCLLPLWEGFDEAYHYGYVQFLSTNWRLPVLGQATLSQEIWHSMELTPVSHYLQPYTHAPVSFSQYFALSPEQRAALRRELESLPASEKYLTQPDKRNYEVNQAPLPYLFMAGIDRGLSALPLTSRVLWLRLVCATLAVLLIAHSTWLLSHQLVLPPLYFQAALFCLFSSQMLYAAICHVSNDTFAPAAMGYLLWAAIRRNWVVLGLALSAALLVKAYFLFLIPLALAPAAWEIVLPLALLASPWYARNLLLYHNLSGTVESTSGVGPGPFLQSALHLPWRESIGYMAHSSLWTGNNSFTTFSSATLNVMLLLLACGVICNFVYARPRPAEWIVIAGVLLFCIGLAIISVAFFASSKGGAIAAVPWYTQVLLAPVLLLAFLGLSRARRWGWALLAAQVVLWGYVLAATYIAKLAPMYGGLGPGRVHLKTLWAWYWTSGPAALVSLGSVPVVWTLIACSIALGMALGFDLVARAGRA